MLKKALKDLPVLIDENKNILLGNIINELFPNCKKIVFKHNLVEERVIKLFNELEEIMIDSFDSKKWYELQKEYKSLVSTFEKQYEIFGLFDDFKESGLITEENFNCPPPYKFEKHSNKKKKQEEEENANLFSGFGK